MAWWELFLPGWQLFLRVLFLSSPLWGAIVLLKVSWILWYRYKQAVYIYRDTKWVDLEIKIPQEISKSPQAMELVTHIFYQTFESNWYERFRKGIVRSWFSLELVSLGGSIHFFLHVPKFFKNLVETQVYSQYPEVEIREVDDYTKAVSYSRKGEWQMWGAELQLGKADPYPIKTYVDYGLDKDPKEEFKIDPMTPLLELLSSIKPDEQVWIQILVMAAKDRFPDPKSWFKKRSWKDEARDVVKKMRKLDEAEKLAKEGKMAPIRFLSPGEEAALKSVERNLDKFGFDCGLRILYLAKNNTFSPHNIAGLLGAFKQFSSSELNSFKPGRKTSFDFPWQDPWGWRVNELKQEMFAAYCRRGYFYHPHRRHPFILTSEELATIYHFPGQVATTPTLERIESKRGEPPVNLPR